MALILFSSASAGTGSAFNMAQQMDQGLMVFVPSASYGTVGFKLTGKLVDSDGMNANNTASFYDLSAIPLSASTDATRIINITSPGLYFYPYVGGLQVQALASPAAANTVTIVANLILKR